MITVKLCKKKRKGRKEYLFLNYTPAIFNQMTRRTYRQEYLGLYVFTEPKGPDERRHNALAMKMGEMKRDARAIEVLKGELGFFDESVLNRSFTQYFRQLAESKDQTWTITCQHFERFVNGKCTFGNLTVELSNNFREYLMNLIKKDGTPISHRSSAAYFSRYRSALAKAYKAGMIKTNINDYLDRIPYSVPMKNFLSKEEVVALKKTPCKYEVLKRAALFSVLTGLRISDILDLKWEDIRTAPDGGPCIIKNIYKVSRDEIVYISDEALEYCGERYESGPVFYNLKKSLTYRPLHEWVRKAGIQRHITFHCFRHTYATLQLANGVDIYTISHQLTHKNVKTTQIYADLVDAKRRNSANAISLNTMEDEQY